MIILPPVLELGSVVVVDPGVPNMERIVFRPTQQVDLGLCGILIGTKDGEGVKPVPNMFFWFGELQVAPPSWILVFTGKGQNTFQKDKDGNAMHVFYWGSDFTFFNFREIVPILVRFAGVTVGYSLKELPAWTAGAKVLAQ